MKSRFAPSPTGFLHLGGARTALFSWLQARAAGGRFVLRIEDTDVERNNAEATQAILEAMEWLGMDCDEGPFYQSQRNKVYRAAAQKLVDEGKAYYCRCSRERLDDLREQQMAAKEKPRYDGHCRDLQHSAEAVDGERPVIRFRNPLEGEVRWVDEVRGEIVIANQELDDLIIWRSDDTPTYNFCVVIDDSEMGISHVLRGDDHINNTPRQINLYQALGKPVPTFAHVPMILGSDGAKLSKRHGAVNVMEYKTAGYLPEAMLNYLVRLGWSHGDQEIFTRDEMFAHFSASEINKAPSAFNLEKLQWINQHWMKAYSPEKLLSTLRDLFPEAALFSMSEVTLLPAIVLYRERVNTLVELAAEVEFLVPDAQLSLDDTAREQLEKPEAKPLLKALIANLESVAENAWQADNLDAICKETAKAEGVKLGALGPLIRIAITGKKQAPSLGDLMVAAGQTLSLSRLRAAS